MEPRDLLLFGGWLVAGLVLPDLDQAIPLLAHRSGLTHSVLLPLLVRWRLGATAGAGAFAGVAIALAEDLFPRAYRGFALIHLPGLGSIGLVTIPWLLANMAASLGLGLHALRNVPRRSTGSYAVVALFALASVAYLLVHKANPGAFVLLWLTAMSLLLLARKRAAWR